ncbi:F-box/FBD/LRR-repeat protein At1g13570-like isoform X1 [Lycium barbarum]|uniref:F-box/FBD/LRR-repeat protein At1g13570-like isoform X1 n=2 Tax=Lycium barbarum TaxID=112863 RepID=UPI00293E8A77|nr:F-box/FBD/LRR-repeat protein At1g13570-like isoform X1 [Lycium barbarum]XP_060207915.1 F-box/FBD/LRR-repeat protein At1g13570-like isoform X1 [Lycium barbarum]XP_060207916.1 F-box/FBD/LRR-repeat protein At1g13570-like isoform X1 [Lycium barbarum]
MRHARSSGVDMLSNLPCHILENILGCLDLRDAVRTSILSKGWRYKWVRRPKLEFGNDEYLHIPQNPIPKTLIYQVLLLHEGPIMKFSLWGHYWRSCPDFDHWILFLSRKNVQEFTLQIGVGNIYHMPSHLFAFQQLRHLKLSSCVFHPPTTFIGFKKLTHIDFHTVTIVPATFGDLISKCPLLEQLRLVACTNFDCLEIDAANLQCFYFIGVLKSICFKNTPKLEQVTVDFRLRVLADEFPVCSNLVKFFHHTPNLKQLNLDGWVLQYLTVGGLPESPPTALNNVRNLNISHMSFENIEEVVGAVYLITRCPRLQYFSMDASIENVEEAGVQFIKAQANSYGGMKVLQKVCMLLIYGGLEPQTEFLRFILSSAPALEEIYILNHAFPDDQVMQMIHEMKQFPCASRNVKFKYEELGTDIVMEVP